VYVAQRYVRKYFSLRIVCTHDRASCQSDLFVICIL